MNVNLSGNYVVTNRSIKVKTCDDICKYYQWLFNRHHFNTIKSNRPRHGAHVGVVSSKIHDVDCTKFLHLNDTPVDFSVDISGNYGGFSRGFLNFWLDAYSVDFINIRKQLNIHKIEPGFSPFHLTILNTK